VLVRAASRRARDGTRTCGPAALHELTITSHTAVFCFVSITEAWVLTVPQQSSDGGDDDSYPLSVPVSVNRLKSQSKAEINREAIPIKDV